MPKLKTGTPIPTAEEDARLTAAAEADPDARPLTDAEWETAKRHLRRGRGPQKAPVKERVSIRLSPEVVQSFRATGNGWQGRVDGVLKDWLKTHRAA
jgi:uncharacterized protein (DUF4415 family)